MKKHIASLLLAVALPAFGESGASLTFTPEQVAAFGIQTGAVESVSQASSKNYPAKVTVPNSRLRVVGAPLEGVIEALLVAEGEQVVAGQPLAQIRSTQLLERQAGFLETLTRRQLSAANLKRDRKLRADGIIAERRLLESEAQHKELLNAEARDRQALHLAGMSDEAIAELERTQELHAVLQVEAPLDGVVLEQMATAGQRLASADPLYRVGDLTTLWVEVHVPLENLGEIAPGGQVDLPQQGIRGEIITVGRMVHGTDQGVLVRAAVTEGAGQLRPGQFTEARLQHTTGVSALRVPASAIVRSTDKAYLFVQQPDGFHAVSTELLNREGDSVVIKASLPADAQVVVRGTAALKAAWGGAE
ncbi:MAG: efflux RND transporter periplasmic adaptor subunit [Candidatus Thiodiazotropha sp.]